MRGARAAACAAAAVLAAATGLAAQEDFRWTGRVEAGDVVEIEGVNGSISAEPASGDEVEVVARKRADRSDPASVRIEVVEHEDGVTICSMYPTPRGERENRCAPGDAGHMNSRDNDVKVDYTVRVPRGVEFRGENVNGDVEAEGLSGRAVAETVNGSIRLATSGVAHARTVNGSIEARMGRADWQGALEFRTVNGGITVYLPDGVGAEVEARSVNGSMETDFPLTVEGRWGPREMRGTLGGGGRTLRLETVNGSIELRRG